MDIRRCLLIFIYLYYAVDGSYRMYQTIQNTNGLSHSAFHCLYGMGTYQYFFGDLPIYQNPSFSAYRYCRSTAAHTDEVNAVPNIVTINGQGFGFHYLRVIGVTAKQLFDWYAPMDTIESYIMGDVNGEFFNCSRSDNNFWFGPKCQYSIGTDTDLAQFTVKKYILQTMTANEALLFTNGTCYVMDVEDCQSVLCLDWREICDGKIDCANGFDEQHCDKIEMNECNSQTEFRCQNGQCIDKVFYLDGKRECMDFSDEFPRSFPHQGCYYDADFTCEDRTCPPTWFSCGSGRCYDGPSTNDGEMCVSNRDLLYFQRMPPSTFTLFSHVSLIHNDTQPEWICYNHTLCPQLSFRDYMISNWQKDNSTVCRKFTAFMNRTYANLHEMRSYFKDFVRSCSLPSLYHLSKECSMFTCDDMSKCLSYHRLSDGYNDCSNGEDERQNNSCSFGFRHRFACDNGTRCIPRILLNDGIGHCADKRDEFQIAHEDCTSMHPDRCVVTRGEEPTFNISFDKICDGILDYFLDTENYTDESDCSINQWPCLHEHTKCNAVWNCPDGSDELDCHTGWQHLHACSLNHSHYCLSITTGLPFCLPQVKAADGHIDCVGSTDERSFCRMTYPHDMLRRYRCQNSDLCISPLQLCDCHQDCPQNDDETLACHWINNGREPFCHSTKIRCRDGQIVDCRENLCRCQMAGSYCSDHEDKMFCDLIDRRSQLSDFRKRYEEHRITKRNIIISNEVESTGFVAWKCNNGLLVRSVDSPSGFNCFCSHWYYGDHCQYQRKRISLVVQPLIVDSFTRLSVFKFVVLLVRQNITILSHDQFFYVPQSHCISKLLISLLYPINESWSLLMNYSVHVHVFVAQTMEYRGSWQWDVPLSFLPVVRLAKRIPFSDTVGSIKQSFNRIYNGNCTACSNSSVCIGYSVDLSRDICACPLNHTGSRCLIIFNPCTEDSCHGHGRCVPLDDRFNRYMNFLCLCDPGWHGEHCDDTTTSIHIYLTDDIVISSFQTILIHVIGPREQVGRLTYFHRVNEETRAVIVWTEFLLLMSDLVFIQLFESLQEYDLYFIPKYTTVDQESFQAVQTISVHLSRSHRCIPIQELLNPTIAAQPRLRRIKHFHKVCRQRNSTTDSFCFYDEKLMCHCDNNNHANCFNFDTKSIGCPWNKCSNRGMCIQNHLKCPTSSSCICEPCSYGSICQFTTSGYSISLDAILGSHVHTVNPNIFYQTTAIKISVLIVVILAITGSFLNVLAIGTFIQSQTRQVGCGIYLLISSVLGLLTMVVLVCKTMLLIGIEQNNISCSLIEFLLKWWPLCSEWFHACVAIERALAVKRQTRYCNRASQVRAKQVTVVLFVLIGMICSPELIYRRTVIDRQDERIWCVFTLNSDKKILQKLYTISDLLLFIVPLAINLITSIIIIMGTHRSNTRSSKYIPRRTNQTIRAATVPRNARRYDRLRNRLAPIRKQIMKHKHILIAPALLGAFSASRLVMSLVAVCTKLDRNPYLTLFAYLIGFFPSMAVLFAFIIPSKNYREACTVFLKAIIPKSIHVLLVHCCRRRHI